MKIKRDISNVRCYGEKPSVTGLLSLIQFDDSDFMQSPEMQRTMAEAATRGTYIHKLIENDLNNKPVTIHKKYRDYVKGYYKYKLINHKQVKFLTEVYLENDLFCGTIDFIGYDMERKVLLLKDWKTSKSKNIPAPLLMKYMAQIYGYNRLINDNVHKIFKLLGIKDLELRGVNREIVVIGENTYKIIEDSRTISGMSSLVMDLSRFYYDIKDGRNPRVNNMLDGNLQLVNDFNSDLIISNEDEQDESMEVTFDREYLNELLDTASEQIFNHVEVQGVPMQTTGYMGTNIIQNLNELQRIHISGDFDGGTALSASDDRMPF